jgi:Protein of unknown function (DUF3040)
MSLAPGERRRLARIEDSLSRSDPRLAAWLTTFTLPVRLRLAVACQRAIMRGSRLARRRRATRLALLAAGLAALSLIVAGVVALSQVKVPACAGHGVRTSAVHSVLSCQHPGSGVANTPNLPGR